MTYLHLCPSIIYTQLQTGPYAYGSAFLIRSIAWYLPGLLHELDSKVFEDGWLLFPPNGQNHFHQMVKPSLHSTLQGPQAQCLNTGLLNT